jgi:hypothetical protein
VVHQNHEDEKNSSEFFEISAGTRRTFLMERPGHRIVPFLKNPIIANFFAVKGNLMSVSCKYPSR